MKSVYTGGEKVAEFESYDELRVGDSKPAFIYEGNELVYPNPVKDGLVLWYDFSGRTNADGQRGIAEDLSGNGNHGTLQNFNYTPESGYDKNKLLFDGVDDYVESNSNFDGVYCLEATFNLYAENSYSSVLSSFNHAAGGQGFVITTVSNGNFRVNRKSTPNNLEVSTFPFGEEIKIGSTYHIIAQFKYLKDDDYMLELYLNGEKFVEEKVSGFFNSGSMLNSPVMVGKYSPPHNGYYYKKPIYSAKAYNRPLTPEEIEHNYAIEKERFGIE